MLPPSLSLSVPCGLFCMNGKQRATEARKSHEGKERDGMGWVILSNMQHIIRLLAGRV